MHLRPVAWLTLLCKPSDMFSDARPGIHIFGKSGELRAPPWDEPCRECIWSSSVKEGWQIGSIIFDRSVEQDAVAITIAEPAWDFRVLTWASATASTLNIEDIAVMYVFKKTSVTSLSVWQLPGIAGYSPVDALVWARPYLSVAIQRRPVGDGC